MNRALRTFAVLAGLLTASTPALAQDPILGFPSSMLAEQMAIEAQARAVPNADTLRDQMRILSAEPHEAGTERSREVAQLILERFRSYGLDAKIERFEALMPRPVARTLEMVAPVQFTATLEEPPLAFDSDSDDANQLPTYNAYSADGDVTAPLVFVNYGIPEDYEVLDSLGISVEGKIVIAKYGHSWRGIKPKVAAEHGAVGAILYSDPEDDGYYIDDDLPEGPMRPEFGVQRGSVMDMPVHPGDPLSPGWASVEGARKLSIDEAKTIMTIPVLPISYSDALPLLENLGGPVAPESWRGALPITYHIGGGPAVVHLALEFDWETRPLYDVIATVPGELSPDQWIVYGNHHDAWVNGAEDPISGMVALGETARSIGELLQTGWRPARTIVFAAWDGEEWGLLGSTEWAEKHQDRLREGGVVYLNTDSNNRGWLGASGSHSLQEFTRQVARDIRDPKTGDSVLEAALEHRGDSTFTIGALGSGSDYTAFIDHLGMASLNASFGGGSHDGVYHSIYDSFDFYTRFSDTTFVYGVAEAQTLATAILRLADAPLLPFEFTAPAETYGEYVDEIEEEAAEQDATRALDLSGVRDAVETLETAAAAYADASAGIIDMSEAEVQENWDELAAVNRLVYRTERLLTDEAGLEGREWFRHLIYAPGFYTGYGVKTMPGIREAVEDRPNAAVAQREAARVESAIRAYADQVQRAAEALNTITRQ